MVVKELRQGLRTRLFGLVMVILHLLLVLITLISGASENARADSLTGVFDSIVTLVLCIIMPLRGFSALADEMRSNTMDMLVLTRLSSWRIVTGKWAAIASQSALIAISISPYVVSRYIFGGLDLFGELSALGLKWLIGCVLAAAVVCLSTQRQFWLRALLIGVPLLFGFFGMMSMAFIGRMGGGSATSAFTMMGLDLSTLQFGVGILFAFWLIFFFLSLAATRIAPQATLLPLLKRSVHGITLLILVVMAVVTSSEVYFHLALWVAVFASMDALVEHVCEVPSVYALFYQKGAMGRLASLFLVPGWASGFLFSCVLIAVVMVAGYEVGLWPLVTRVAAQAAGVWLVAVILQVTPARRNENLLGAYLAIAILVSIGNAILMAIGASFQAAASMSAIASGHQWLLAMFPGTLEQAVSMADVTAKERVRLFGMLCSLLWPVLLLLLAFRAFWQTREVRTQADHLIQERRALS